MKIVLEFDGIDELHHFTEHWYHSLIPKRTYRNELDDLEFTVRTENCLKGAGIKTLNELCAHTREELLMIANFGKRCLDEVEARLALRGRSLATTQEAA